MKKASIAYQIFSARDEAQQDLYAVLKALKEMGYDGVEFAGFYGHSAQEVRAMLDEIGLKGFSNHLSIAQIEADMEGEIAFHKTIGCEYIAIPFLDDNMRPGGPGFAHAIQVIYKFGRLCKEAGIQLLYHNHDFEFMKLDNGQTALDYFYEKTDPKSVYAEIDVHWVTRGGSNPALWIRKVAGRMPVVHFKDFAYLEDGPHFCEVGEGNLDWPSILEACRETNVRWYSVEQDAEFPGRDIFESIKISYDNLRKMGVK